MESTLNVCLARIAHPDSAYARHRNLQISFLFNA
jgi:hypothetical protein